jgi:cation diffusion facilitator CzcD-associated flavoprotein CzcO
LRLLETSATPGIGTVIPARGLIPKAGLMASRFPMIFFARMGMARTFSAQPGTLPYFNYVADKFNFRPEIQFISRVAAAHLDGSATRWTVTLEDARTSARDYEFDMLIYATRFDGVTGPL